MPQVQQLLVTAYVHPTPAPGSGFEARRALSFFKPVIDLELAVCLKFYVQQREKEKPLESFGVDVNTLLFP